MKPHFRVGLDIKTRLAFQFMAIVMVILFVFVYSIYYFTYSTQKEKFKMSLLNRAKYTSLVLSKSNAIDTTFLNNVFSSTYAAQDQEVVLLNTYDDYLYAYNQKEITGTIIETCQDKTGPHYFFSTRKKEGVSVKFRWKSATTTIIVMAHDNIGWTYLRDLKYYLIWSILITLAFSMAMAYIFSKNALKPINTIINKVQQINAGNLNIRLQEGSGKDELELLSITFNTMLDRLEYSFNKQSEFVANASHELKTPLAVLLAESEYLLSKPQNIMNYKMYVEKNIAYVHQFNEHLNNLLELAKINQKTTIETNWMRVDELIYDAIKIVRDKYLGRKIITKLDLPDDETGLMVLANYSLMVLALKNLLDNACKFSVGEVVVRLNTKSLLNIMIEDKGIGISHTDLKEIFNPYKRGENARFVGGYGIGLALVSRIIEAHGFSIEINSTINQGTHITILFPHQNPTAQG